MTYRKLSFLAAGLASVSLLTGGFLFSQAGSNAKISETAAVSQSLAGGGTSGMPSSARQAAVQEFTEMFREGLRLSQSQDNAFTDKGGAMVEAALVQGTEYPEAYAKFWTVYRAHLEKHTFSTAVKVSMLETFSGIFADTSAKCRSRAEFESFWNVQKEVEEFLETLENQLTDSDTADTANGTDENKTETASQTALAEIQEGLHELEAKWLKLKEETKDKINWDAFNKKTIVGRDPESTAPFEKGETYLFMEELQKFTQEELDTDDLAQLLESFPEETFQIRQQVQELLEKGRVLNQTRYNLWANFVIHNAPMDVSGIDWLRWISPDHLHPALSSIYQSRLSKCLEESRDPYALTDNILQMTLAEKVPLSAF